MGCHGTAGTSVAMVPGIEDTAQWLKHKPYTTLDFNQQYALAKRNYETAIPKKEK
jgi:hypothetical protein